jgi:hypothetical protein
MVRLLEKKRSDILPLFALGTLGIQGVLLLLTLGQSNSLAQMSEKQTPTLVQLEDGKAVRVGTMDYNDRTPQTIRRFVGDTMIMLMNWSGTLPPTSPEESRNPKPDPGVSLGTKKVAQATWQAGFALSEDFRGEFLKLVADLMSQEVFKGNAQAVFVINYISNPTKVENGKWKMSMVANLIIFSKGDNAGKAIAFNKEIFVRSVEAPRIPAGASELEKAIYQVRQSGLEIYAIRDLVRENL